MVMVVCMVTVECTDMVTMGCTDMDTADMDMVDMDTVDIMVTEVTEDIIIGEGQVIHRPIQIIPSRTEEILQQMVQAG